MGLTLPDDTFGSLMSCHLGGPSASPRLTRGYSPAERPSEEPSSFRASGTRDRVCPRKSSRFPFPWCLPFGPWDQEWVQGSCLKPIAPSVSVKEVPDTSHASLSVTWRGVPVTAGTEQPEFPLLFQNSYRYHCYIHKN